MLPEKLKFRKLNEIPRAPSYTLYYKVNVNNWSKL
jgi:hypothetical protein